MIRLYLLPTGEACNEEEKEEEEEEEEEKKKKEEEEEEQPKTNSIKEFHHLTHMHAHTLSVTFTTSYTARHAVPQDEEFCWPPLHSLAWKQDKCQISGETTLQPT